MSEVILYFGSFNPVHNGHTAVAGWVSRQGLADEVWMVVSPQNPMKEGDGLAPDADRLAMARIAVDERLAGLPVRVSDVEFSLPRPSYTIDTLRFLERENPGVNFSILGGADIVGDLPKWKEHEELLARHKFFIYPRDGYRVQDTPEITVSEGASGVTVLEDTPGVTVLEGAPRWEFSSTDVRRVLADGGDAGDMIARGVGEYIEAHGLWRPSTAEGWLARGRRLGREGRMGDALNAYIRVLELDPANSEAAERVKMLREIFAFHYVDYYNP